MFTWTRFLGSIRYNFISKCNAKYSSRANSEVLPFSSFRHGCKTAIVDPNKRTYNYQKLFCLSVGLRDVLNAANRTSLLGERIAFITPNNSSYTVCQWAIWLSGAIAVPLCTKHPPSELEYVLRNSQSSTVVSTQEYAKVACELANEVSINHVCLPEDWMENYKQTVSQGPISSREQIVMPDDFQHRPAMIVYTSGTTGRPKGVIHTHSSVNAQITDMITAWKWNSSDVILHVLPLHHVHGIVNLLMCPLSVGATVVMENDFNAEKVWNHLLQKSDFGVNVFMAVPTIYAKLIEYFDAHELCPEETRERCKKIRLMVSGSAALPLSLFSRWKEITGHTLLERYGMTEFGMGITNSYHGRRVPGAVGLPFPGVSVKIVEADTDGKIDLDRCILHAEGSKVIKVPEHEGEQGELLVQTPSMFKCYWNNPEATTDSFIEGWFKTGDTAIYEDGVIRISGRTSVDIIKSGGYKISALDIEHHLLHHPDIRDVAVLGVPDPVWGQRIVAIIKSGSEETQFTATDLRDWCRSRMPSYQIPKEFQIVREIPRNVMGKINKKDLLHKYYGKPDKSSL